MEQHITIREIAAEAGVSTGTVHRALYGKKGLSEATRQRILQICSERGYRANTAASALRRRPLCIAAAFPAPRAESSYYYSRVWRGFHRRMAELDGYHLKIIEQTYATGTEDGQCAALTACREQCGGQLDALLTIGPVDERARRAVRRYADAGVPVFFACDDAADCGRIACVQADYDMTGRLAAELLSSQLAQGGAVLLCAGDPHIPSHRQAADAFEAYLRETRAPLLPLRVDGYADPPETARRIAQALAGGAQVRGAFSVSARLSVLLMEAVSAAGLSGRVRVIASDLFEQTAEGLRQGLVSNILYKDPARQAYLAARLMTEYLLRGAVPEEPVQYVESRVIFGSSLAYYLRMEV